MPEVCTEKHLIKGTEICILDRSEVPLAFKQMLRPLLRLTLESIPFATRFVRLRLVLKTNATATYDVSNPRQWLAETARHYDAYASCSAEEFVSPNEGPTIDLFVDAIFGAIARKADKSSYEASFQKSETKQLAVLLDETLRHELVHLTQFQTNKYAEKHAHWESRAAEIIVERATPSGIDSMFSVARHLLTNFTVLVWAEGLATMFQKPQRYDQATNVEYYDAAKKAALVVAEAVRLWQGHLQKVLSAQEDAKRYPQEARRAQTLIFSLRELTTAMHSVFVGASYQLGLHMVYTLAYAYKLDPEKLEPYLQWNRRELFKLYEKGCARLGFTPVFSFSSNAGILDYTRMVGELMGLAGKFGIQVK